MPIKKLGKLPKGKITIDELINTEPIIGLANKLIEEKFNIEEAILITTDKDWKLYIDWVEPISRARLIGLLEMAKNILMQDD